MARQTHIVRSDEPVRVTVEPAGPPAAGEAWFRLFRSLVHGGTWATLGPAPAKVLIVLAECVNDAQRRDTGRWVAWPSVALIAERAGLQRRAVQKALADLEARGLISRCRRRTARRGDYSSEFELHPPGERGEDDARSPDPAHADAPGGAAADAQGGAHPSAQGVRPSARGAGARGCAQQSKRNNEIDQTAAASREADDALRAAGVAAGVRAKLLAGHDPAEVFVRVDDWLRRRRLGQRIGPAWLVASLRDGYDLHAETAAELDRRDRAQQLERRREQERLEVEREQAEAARVEAEAEAMLAGMDDDELASWREAVVRDLPSLTRGLQDADPREHPRLRRLVLGRLASVIGDPGPAGPSR